MTEVLFSRENGLAATLHQIRRFGFLLRPNPEVGKCVTGARKETGPGSWEGDRSWSWEGDRLRVMGSRQVVGHGKETGRGSWEGDRSWSSESD